MTKRISPTLRDATEEDAQAIADIYNHFINETVVTFEVEPLMASQMLQRIKETTQSYPWLVAEVAGKVAGYAYASRWHARHAYRFTAEMTVYLDPSQVGQGLGTLLYQELIQVLSSTEIRTVIGGIALPNEASVALHESLGFRKAAHYQRVGFKFDRWIDVGYWQRML
ncbi:MAG: arsinothricin resistance N-acetyltransferase ArsN1 family B [Rubripirellula sp.]